MVKFSITFYWPFLVNNDQAEFGKNDENHNLAGF